MFEQRLIQTVYAHECIWNKNCADYRDKILKNAAWSMISNIVREPEDLCRKRWKSLRDRFVMDLVAKQSDDSYCLQQPSKYYEEMIFLTDVVNPKRLQGNVSVDSDECVEDLEDEDLLIEKLVCDEADDLINDTKSQQSTRTNNTMTSTSHNGTKSHLEKTFTDLVRTVNVFIKSKRQRPQQDHILATIGDFFEKVPEDKRTQFKMDVLGYTYKRYKQYAF